MSGRESRHRNDGHGVLLHVSDLQRSGALVPGARSLVRFGEETVLGLVMSGSMLTVVGPALDYGGQYLLIEGTPCYFGGERRWLVCPDCAKRRAALSLGRGGFSCRVCLERAGASWGESLRHFATRVASHTVGGEGADQRVA